jgi:hypothetical protein
VAEALALEMVVGDLADPFGAQRLPGEIAVAVPATRGAGHALAGGSGGFLPLGPLRPGVIHERVLTERRQLLDQLPPSVHREAGGDPDAIEPAGGVEQPQQERADERPRPVLVPSKPGHHAVGGAGVLDLGPATLGRHVGVGRALGDDAIQPGALEAIEPVRGDRRIGRRGRQVDGRLCAGEGPLEEGAPLALGSGTQVTAVECEEIPGHEAGGGLGREQLDA